MPWIASSSGDHLTSPVFTFHSQLPMRPASSAMRMRSSRSRIASMESCSVRARRPTSAMALACGTRTGSPRPIASVAEASAAIGEEMRRPTSRASAKASSSAASRPKASSPAARHAAASTACAGMPMANAQPEISERQYGVYTAAPSMVLPRNQPLDERASALRKLSDASCPVLFSGSTVRATMRSLRSSTTPTHCRGRFCRWSSRLMPSGFTTAERTYLTDPSRMIGTRTA
jgi:hypothetical protein